MAASAAEILRQLELNEPRIRAAFLEVVGTILGRARISEIERYIETGRYDRIALALGWNEASLSPLVEAIRSSVASGGLFESANVSRLQLTFNMRNRVVEGWLRQYSSQFVTNILSDQREAIRTIVSAGTELGRNPRQTALDIVGRINQGRRSGGVVGLTNQQAQFVANARAQLLSADPAQLRAYLQRAARDRRFDPTIMRAIRDGRALSAADVDRITGRYADRLLALRGETIARTEALTGFNAGRDLTYRQAIESGQIDARSVQKTWRTASDSKVRESHRSLGGETLPFDGVFVSSTGARMKHPGDTSLGAGAGDVANCRCVASYSVDWIAQELGGG